MLVIGLTSKIRGSGPYLPFNVGNGYLTIRAQLESDGKYYGGLLSSVDSKGNGFSQKYGYFEMSAMLPSGLGTWPAFWLMDVTGLVTPSQNHHEIDILEAYGDGPGIMRSTLHYWDSSNSSGDWGYGQSSIQCSMYHNFHTYGMDIQPDFLTVYYDRMEVMRFPNKIPNVAENYDRPLYIMVNLAIGGGSSRNNETNLNKGPQDMLVQYVKVWQGSGGSNNANSTEGALSLTWVTASFTLNANQVFFPSIPPSVPHPLPNSLLTPLRQHSLARFLVVKSLPTRCTPYCFSLMSILTENRN
jgi:beta-glucanase (GH16 family)